MIFKTISSLTLLGGKARRHVVRVHTPPSGEAHDVRHESFLQPSLCE